MTDKISINQVNQAVSQKDINSIIEFINNDKIERVTCYKSNGSEYNAPKMHTILSAALQHEDNKGAVIHGILLHFVQNSDKYPLEGVIRHLEKAIAGRIYEKNNPIRNPYEEFRTHMNYSGKVGSLLHQAVINDNTEAIETLLKYGANSLIRNKEDKMPLDLAQEEKTREVLIECMKDQAQSKKESARCNGLIGIIPGVFLGVGLGIGSALVPSMTIILCALAVSALVAGIAVGLTIYFLSQDYKQAKSTEEAVNPQSSPINHAKVSKISDKTIS